MVMIDLFPRKVVDPLAVRSQLHCGLTAIRMDAASGSLIADVHTMDLKICSGKFYTSEDCS